VCSQRERENGNNDDYRHHCWHKEREREREKWHEREKDDGEEKRHLAAVLRIAWGEEAAASKPERDGQRETLTSCVGDENDDGDGGHVFLLGASAQLSAAAAAAGPLAVATDAAAAISSESPFRSPISIGAGARRVYLSKFLPDFQEEEEEEDDASNKKTLYGL